MKQLLWDLFCKTGKIEYYMKYKDLIGKRSEVDGKRNQSRGDI